MSTTGFDFVWQWNTNIRPLRPLPRRSREDWMRAPVGPPPARVPTLEDIDLAMRFIDEQMTQIEFFGEGWRGQTYARFEVLLHLLNYLYHCHAHELETGQES